MKEKVKLPILNNISQNNNNEDDKKDDIFNDGKVQDSYKTSIYV